MKASILQVCTLAVVSIAALSGCEKKPPTTTTPAPTTAPSTQPMAVDTGGQTICPVGGGKINPAVFAEYQGKKVYFCCEGCIEPFKKQPEKYVKKLPQFGGKEEPGSGGMTM